MVRRNTSAWRRMAAVVCAVGLFALYPLTALAQAGPSGATTQGPGVTAPQPLGVTQSQGAAPSGGPTEIGGVQVERSAVTLPNTGTGPVDQDESSVPRAVAAGIVVLAGASLYVGRRWLKKQIGA